VYGEGRKEGAPSRGPSLLRALKRRRRVRDTEKRKKRKGAVCTGQRKPFSMSAQKTLSVKKNDRAKIESGGQSTIGKGHLFVFSRRSQPRALRRRKGTSG